MPQRPITPEHFSWLKNELSHWHSEGLLPPETPEQILNRYEIPQKFLEAKQRQTSLVLMTTLSLAALLFGLAVLLVVCFNWKELSWQIKLVILLGSLAIANLKGLVFRSLKWEMLSEVTFFFAAILYGVGIWQIAQIFHIQTHYPQGMWFWALGVFPLAFCMKTPLLHVFAAVLICIWAGWEILGYANGVFYFRFMDSPIHFQHGAYSLLIFVAIGLYWGYRKHSQTVVTLYAVTLLWWLCLLCKVLHLRWAGCWFILLLGMLYLFIGDRHQSKLGRAWRIPGLLLTAGALVPMTFWRFYDSYHSYYHFYIDGDQWITVFWTNFSVLLLTTVVFFAFAWWGWRKRALHKENHGLQSHDPLPPLLYLCAGMGAILAIPLLGFTRMGTARLSGLSDIISLGFVICINAAMVIFAFHLIMQGFHREKMQVYLMGVLYFLLWTALRYFDLFGEYGRGGMLGAAALFAFCSICLAGTVLYWHLRKKGENHVK